VPAQPTMLDIDPLVTFRFLVNIGGKDAIGIFTECKLPDIEWDIQEQKEGGLNTHTHQLIGQQKAKKCSLKQGLTKKLEFLDWYAAMVKEDFTAYRKTITITLVDLQLKPVLRWNLFDAYPSKVTWPDLKTADNVIAIQSLDLVCGRVEFEKM